MKVLLKSLVLITLLSSILYSCEEKGRINAMADITFDGRSSLQVGPDHTLHVFGEITSPEGTTIETIAASSVFSNEENKSDHAVFTKMGGDGITKIADNHYVFDFTESTGTLKEHIARITHIKLDVTIKNGKGSTKSWEVQSPKGGAIIFNTFSWPKPFEWNIKLGSPADSSGVEYFGLVYDDITPEGLLVIKPNNQVTTFKKINEDIWSTVDLYLFTEQIEPLPALLKYEALKTEGEDETHFYSDYLAVVYKGRAYKIMITESYRSKYWVLTVKGEYREQVN